MYTVTVYVAVIFAVWTTECRAYSVVVNSIIKIILQGVKSNFYKFFVFIGNFIEIHLQPSFAVLSEEINILLIAPHWFCKGLYIDSSI